MVEKQNGVKILKAQGDAELVVKQVRDQYAIENSWLKNNKVVDEIESWEAFSIF